MYKKRISAWRVKKNYKAEEKRAIAQAVKTYHDNATPIPKITVRGQPADFDKVRRFCKDERFLEEILPTFGKSADTGSPQKVATETAEDALVVAVEDIISRQPTRVANGKDDELMATDHVLYKSSLVLPQSHYIEMILHHIATFVDSRCAGVNPPKSKGSLRILHSKHPSQLEIHDERLQGNSHPQLMWEKYVFGLTYLRVNRFKRGFQLLDEGCQLAGDTLRQWPVDLLCDTFLTLCDATWQDFPSLRVNLINFLARMSSHALGETHPVTKALHCLRRDGLVATAAEACFAKLVSALESSPGSSLYELNRARRNFCDLLRRKQHLTSAEKAGLHTVKQSEQVFGKTHPLTRRDLRRLVHVYTDQGRYQLAEKTCLDLLQRGARATSITAEDEGLSDMQLRQDHITTAGWRDMATICKRRGDFERAQLWQERAVDSSVRLSGFEDLETASTISRLQFLMNAQGHHSEAQLLRQQYPEKCFDIVPWLLGNEQLSPGPGTLHLSSTR
jgi:hypothetical protein